MFFIISSFTIVFELLNYNMHVNLYYILLRRFASEKIHRERVLKIPISVRVIHYYAVYHQPKSEGPYMLKIVIFIPKMHPLYFKLKAPG